MPPGQIPLHLLLAFHWYHSKYTISYHTGMQRSDATSFIAIIFLAFRASGQFYVAMMRYVSFDTNISPQPSSITGYEMPRSTFDMRLPDIWARAWVITASSLSTSYASAPRAAPPPVGHFQRFDEHVYISDFAFELRLFLLTFTFLFLSFASTAIP